MMPDRVWTGFCRGLTKPITSAADTTLRAEALPDELRISQL
jgi:hypothetical protein